MKIKSNRVSKTILALTGATVLLLSLSAASFPAHLTQKSAWQVIVQDYKINAKADATLNVALQNSHEEGYSAKMDDEEYTLLGLEGQTSAPAPATPTKSETSIYLSSAIKAPAEFLAIIKVKADKAKKESGYTQYLVFRKDSASAPWRLLYEPAAEASIKAPPVTESGGVATIKQQGSPFPLVALGNYLTTGKAKVAPTPYAKAIYSSDEAMSKAASAKGAMISNSYTLASEYNLTTVAVAGGHLEFGAVIDGTSTIAPPGECLTVNSSSTANYKALVPPTSTYTSDTVKGLDQVVVFVPSNKKLPVKWLGYDFQLMSADNSACP